MEGEYELVRDLSNCVISNNLERKYSDSTDLLIASAILAPYSPL